jgi:Zn-dependent protease with chaperone function
VASGSSKSVYLFFALWVCISLTVCAPAWGQEVRSPEVPSTFNLDMKAAERLRPQLTQQSVAASGRYATGRAVFDRLLEQAVSSSSAKFVWQLRIVDDSQLNAFSSPDGIIYVESGLARLGGSNAGLWAAILSHEIAHILRRDWARRYLYQKYLENGGGAGIVLGDPGLPAANWSASEKASADMGRFCRQMEVEADREGLMLMAKAGYHPDFVPALHHLLHAQGLGVKTASIYAMHPCWEERDRELNHAYSVASIEFARLWPDWYASPGGNPPVVVFAEEATVKKTGTQEWQIRVPMRCQNLVGAVQVVLSDRSGSEAASRRTQVPEQSSDSEMKDPETTDSETSQLTGCTSPKTTITFTLAEPSASQKTGTQWTDVYVFDSSSGVLARTELPKLHR